MKTHDLIAVLASGLQPVDPHRADRMLLVKAGVAALLALLLMFAFLGLRPDIGPAMGLPMFWLKLAFTASLAVAGLVLLHRLGHPGLRLGRSPLGLAVPLAIAWLMAAGVLVEAAPGERVTLVLGQTWVECPGTIAALSVPPVILAFWALRGLAPTRPTLAGAVAGVFAGAVAASAYALHCPEMEAPFLAVWYVLGMLIPVGVGAALGRRLLHW